jgi:signal transduction histidine kinase/ActR/RegA family two-component response regulator
MTAPAAALRESRVLVLAPTARDLKLTQSILEEAGISCAGCMDLAQLCERLERGAGAVLVPEEAVAPYENASLAAFVARQPNWSDLPILVLARPGADSAGVAQAMDQLGNVTVLERPIRIAAMVSTVRSALRARQRQYQIREYLADRERVAAELRENDRRKDEFLAVLAHELRNPLAPIRHSLHVLREARPDDPLSTRLGAILDRQVDQMVRLVEDLIEVSRITRGKITLRRERVDLPSVVSSAIETSRPLIEEAGHHVEVQLPCEPLWLDGDPVRLAQIFANLLNNAAKYTDAPGRIWFTARRDAGQVILSVRDTGCGIPPAMLGSVFEAFTQIADRRVQGGLGIGLTLVKRLVELHGGSVEASSGGLGHGSEFVVRLPLAGAPEASAEHTSEPASVDAVASRRILVVDDNVDSADSLAILLRRLGADVRVAYSGPEALKALEEQRADVVLLDIGMPGMSGHELARRIRQQPALADVVLIALTGWGQAEDRHRSEAVGIDRHLIKPVEIEVLKSTLASVDELAGASRARAL